MLALNHQINSLYFSPTGTTQSIVEAIANQLTNRAKIYDITLPENRLNPPSFGKKDLLILGSPVYAGRVPELIHDYISHLKGNQTPVILIAVYGNRAYEDTLIELYDMLYTNGFIPISAGAFIGEHSYTNKVGTQRPDSTDLAIAKDFSLSSYKIIQENPIEEIVLKLPGNHPYKELLKRPSLGPTLKPSCILCNTCVTHCPTGALSIEDKLIIDDSKCIQCCSCVKKCPVNALEFGGVTDIIRENLIKNCKSYKNPEIFFASPI